MLYYIIKILLHSRFVLLPSFKHVSEHYLHVSLPASGVLRVTDVFWHVTHAKSRETEHEHIA